MTVRAHDDGGLETYGTAPAWMDPPDDTDEVTIAIVIQEPPANHDPVADNDNSEVGTSGAKKGQVEPTAGGVRCTAGSNFAGEDTFSYTVGDGRGGAAEGTVHVTIAPDTAPPWSPPRHGSSSPRRYRAGSSR